MGAPAAAAERIRRAYEMPDGSIEYYDYDKEPSEDEERSVALRMYARHFATKEGIDPDNFIRMIEAESSFNPRAVSTTGIHKGLGQLSPDVAKAYGVTDVFDPVQNLRASAAYIHKQLERYGGDWAFGLSGYNAGAGNVKKYGGVPPFPETQNYIRKILGEEALADALARTKGRAGAKPPKVDRAKLSPGELRQRARDLQGRNRILARELSTADRQLALFESYEQQRAAVGAGLFAEATGPATGARAALEDLGLLAKQRLLPDPLKPLEALPTAVSRVPLDLAMLEKGRSLVTGRRQEFGAEVAANKAELQRVAAELQEAPARDITPDQAKAESRIAQGEALPGMTLREDIVAALNSEDARTMRMGGFRPLREIPKERQLQELPMWIRTYGDSLSREQGTLENVVDVRPVDNPITGEQMTWADWAFLVQEHEGIFDFELAQRESLREWEKHHPWGSAWLATGRIGRAVVEFPFTFPNHAYEVIREQGVAKGVDALLEQLNPISLLENAPKDATLGEALEVVTGLYFGLWGIPKLGMSLVGRTKPFRGTIGEGMQVVHATEKASIANARAELVAIAKAVGITKPGEFASVFVRKFRSEWNKAKAADRIGKARETGAMEKPTGAGDAPVATAEPGAEARAKREVLRQADETTGGLAETRERLKEADDYQEKVRLVEEFATDDPRIDIFADEFQPAAHERVQRFAEEGRSASETIRRLQDEVNAGEQFEARMELADESTKEMLEDIADFAGIGARRGKKRLPWKIRYRKEGAEFEDFVTAPTGKAARKGWTEAGGEGEIISVTVAAAEARAAGYTEGGLIPWYQRGGRWRPDYRQRVGTVSYREFQEVYPHYMSFIEEAAWAVGDEMVLAAHGAKLKTSATGRKFPEGGKRVSDFMNEGEQIPVPVFKKAVELLEQQLGRPLRGRGAKPPPKEPWEMGADEFADWHRKDNLVRYGEEAPEGAEGVQEARARIVREAVERGADVPIEILQEFRDLFEPEVGEPGAAKEPWEMTREEFIPKAIEEVRQQRAGGLSPEEAKLVGVEAVGAHAQVVRKALGEGKPVPPEVLKDYPDLAAPEAGRVEAAREALQGRQERLSTAVNRLKRQMEEDRPKRPRRGRREREGGFAEFASSAAFREAVGVAKEWIGVQGAKGRVTFEQFRAFLEASGLRITGLVRAYERAFEQAKAEMRTESFAEGRADPFVEPLRKRPASYERYQPPLEGAEPRPTADQPPPEGLSRPRADKTAREYAERPSDGRWVEDKAAATKDFFKRSWAGLRKFEVRGNLKRFYDRLIEAFRNPRFEIQKVLLRPLEVLRRLKEPQLGIRLTNAFHWGRKRTFEAWAEQANVVDIVRREFKLSRAQMNAELETLGVKKFRGEALSDVQKRVMVLMSQRVTGLPPYEAWRKHLRVKDQYDPQRHWDMEGVEIYTYQGRQTGWVAGRVAGFKGETMIVESLERPGQMYPVQPGQRIQRPIFMQFENYFGRVIKDKWVQKFAENRKDQQQMAREMVEQRPELWPNDRAAMNALREWLTEATKERTPGAYFGGFERARQFPLPEEAYELDYMKTVRTISQRAYERMAFAKFFGPEPTVIEGFIEMLSPTEQRFARDVMRQLYGRGGMWDTVASYITTIEAMEKLTGFTTNFVQMFEFAKGLGGARASVWPAALRALATKRKRMEMTILGGFERNYLADIAPNPETAIFRFADTVFTTVGLKHADIGVKVGTLLPLMKDFEARLVDIAKRGDYSKGDARFFERLGLRIDDPMMDTFLREVQTVKGSRARKIEQINEMLQSDQFEHIYATVVGELVDANIHTGRPTAFPLFMANPLARTAFLFWRPAYGYARWVIDEIAIEMFHDYKRATGNLVKFVGSGLLLSEAVRSVKQIVTMRDPDEEGFVRAMLKGENQALLIGAWDDFLEVTSWNVMLRGARSRRAGDVEIWPQMEPVVVGTAENMATLIRDLFSSEVAKRDAWDQFFTREFVIVNRFKTWFSPQYVAEKRLRQIRFWNRNFPERITPDVVDEYERLLGEFPDLVIERERGEETPLTGAMHERGKQLSGKPLEAGQRRRTTGPTGGGRSTGPGR